jgi:hypothetical protein
MQKIIDPRIQKTPFFAFQKNAKKSKNTDPKNSKKLLDLLAFDIISNANHYDISIFCLSLSNLPSYVTCVFSLLLPPIIGFLFLKFRKERENH